MVMVPSMVTVRDMVTGMGMGMATSLEIIKRSNDIIILLSYK